MIVPSTESPNMLARTQWRSRAAVRSSQIPFPLPVLISSRVSCVQLAPRSGAELALPLGWRGRHDHGGCCIHCCHCAGHGHSALQRGAPSCSASGAEPTVLTWSAAAVLLCRVEQWRRHPSVQRLVLSSCLTVRECVASVHLMPSNAPQAEGRATSGFVKKGAHR